MDSFVLGLRVLVSLGAVLGLIWVLQRRVKKRGGLVRAAGPAISVLGRQGIGHKASVVLLDADGQRLLLGVTEHGVSVLRSTASAEAAAGVTDGSGSAATGAATGPVAATAPASFATSLSAATATAAVATPVRPTVVPERRGRRSATPFAPTLGAADLDLPAGTAAVTASFSGPDHGSILLAATAPAATAPAVPAPAPADAFRSPAEQLRPRGRHAAAVPASSGPLSGSILDLGTWRQARDAARWVAGGRRP